jgi:hypothetical protein
VLARARSNVLDWNDGKQRQQIARSHHKQYGLLQNPSQKEVDEKHHLKFMIT